MSMPLQPKDAAVRLNALLVTGEELGRPLPTDEQHTLVIFVASEGLDGQQGWSSLQER